MTNEPGKVLREVKTNSIVNYKIKSSKDTISQKKLISSEWINYLKIKEMYGISLYTHIQALLDLFIFQNPIKPIEYFEYYSEQLKQYYHRPRPNPDLDFMNNIKFNVCKKLTDIYKDTGVKNKEDLMINLSSYKEDWKQNEGENEFEDNTIRKIEEPDLIVIQDLSKINYLFNKVGCGLTNDEAYLIEITMNQMSNLDKFKNIRYWGKIFGLKCNYYVLECEWQNKELKYKLMILNNLMSNNINNYKDGYENMYEYEDVVGSEMADIFSTEIYEQSKEEVSKTKLPVPNKSSNDIFNDSSIFESNLQDAKLCGFSSAESTIDDYEMFGFGTNKKSYFVTNQLNDEWVELPLLRPHHIIQSRNINRYFVGDLEAPVNSYPLFQGLEKHYLRAQIARISAETHISPRDYFIVDSNGRKSNDWTGLSSFQSKVLSEKWIHEYVVNKNYKPPSVYTLLNPTNWVHHTPLITNEGVTEAWAKLRKSQSDSEVKFRDVHNYGNEDIANHVEMIATTEPPGDGLFNSASDSSDPAVEYPGLHVILSDDARVGDLSPWKFETTNAFDGMATHASVRSNLWPGAFAVARESLMDYTYCGWGQKWREHCCWTSIFPNEFWTEYQGDGSSIIEMKDPIHNDEKSFYAKIELLKKQRKKARTTVTHLAVYDVNEDDDEKILNNTEYF